MTIEDQVLAINTKLDALTTAVAAITPQPPVDLAPVLNALADIRAQFNPTV